MSRRLTWSGLLLLLLGSGLVAWNYQHNNRYDWQPVSLPLAMTAGAVAEAGFVADADTAYELEIRFADLPRDLAKKFVTVREQPSPLDIEWTVSDESGVVASGDCRRFLYTRQIRKDGFTRVRNAASNHPSQIVEVGERFFARGVASFKARAGATYSIGVRVNTSPAELSTFRPVFGARVNRVFADRHYRSLSIAYQGGLAMIGLALLLLVWSAVAARLRAGQ